MKIATIDWETVSLDPCTAYLLEFGYVIADTARPNKILATKRIVVPEIFNERNNLRMSLSTIKWWLLQAMENHELGYHTLETIDRCTNDGEYRFTTDMNGFCIALREHDVEGLFCTDKSFDLVILKKVLEALDLILPLNYKQLYETRYWSAQSHPHCFSSIDKTLAHTAQDDALYLFKAIAHVLNNTTP